MKKRIPVGDLKVGMYVHELGGSWLDHPFWRSSFKIESQPYLRRVQESGIQEVWIDTARGLDVDGGISEESNDIVVDLELGCDALEPVPAGPVEAEKEVARAAKIIAASVRAVSAMFQDARLGKIIRMDGVFPVVDEIAGSVLRNPGVLVALARLRSKDNYTYLHSVSVCALMVALSRQLGLDQDAIQEAGLAGLMHDIGKLRIDGELLNKKGQLEAGEFNALRRHATLGYEILCERSEAGEMVLDVCRHHHERFDGSGYPDQLKGEDISLYSRMAAVCDVYDATTSNRPYKAAWPAAYALRKMTEWSASHFDNRIFHAFVKTVGIYPIGTLVRLTSDHLAVVLGQSGGSLLSPRVKVFYSIADNRRVPPWVVDLSAETEHAIHCFEDPKTWGVTDLHTLWSGVDKLSI